MMSGLGRVVFRLVAFCGPVVWLGAALPAMAQAVIASAGATLVSESCVPANGVVDPGEAVTVSFCVQNIGTANTVNLVGTLQATGGVTSPSGPQNYGALIAGGAPVCRNFTWVASGVCGGSVTASVQFQDGVTDLGTVTYTFTLGTPGPTCCSAPCTIICPANITVSNDPNQCGAVVTYPAPSTTGTCGTVTSLPASGSFFPLGTTTVTATTTGGPSCTFTITVIDTQPPSITCPVNVQQTVPPGQNAAVVNYPGPVTTDNCPGVSTLCAPVAGSSFPLGSTIVSCTATDGSGNTATCTFNVDVINGAAVPLLSGPALLALGLLLTGAAIFLLARR